MTLSIDWEAAREAPAESNFSYSELSARTSAAGEWPKRKPGTILRNVAVYFEA